MILGRLMLGWIVATYVKFIKIDQDYILGEKSSPILHQLVDLTHINVSCIGKSCGRLERNTSQ